MSITYVRLSTSSTIKEKLDILIQESGKSIDEIVNLALENYLKNGCNLPSRTINETTNLNDGDDDKYLNAVID
ncbi:hypothetical protein Dtox_1265 [Desulfofarcimen acetoxidans DSM 771]|jgi:hypothetical protein|uniref:Ribbon-helix-helix protein CopG domain-containing protein n=1 Tax=Desulfofarcimen acetoxidans (strain ATCC 49208 / DSM 771 / KCTC 5769 / VKM B-1644 / 5575) TaxID=485916 RepID=C8W5G5_DESAS|nr:hypothetical protein [Desulfofarcimen acetoxidans]ACV62147.1 hypothetical protein Dtox_1265 [Desulfofarcimen acetoxidans DSM 771]